MRLAGCVLFAWGFMLNVAPSGAQLILTVVLDLLGWLLLAIFGLLFGIPYARFFLRAKAIPTWPTVLARVTQASACQGSPTAPSRFSGLLFHCAVWYEFEASGLRHKGRFALMTGDEMIAMKTAELILHREVPIRYNPRNPSDSVTAEKEILGRKVFQKQSWLNPRAW
jgi:hypothetical protein